MLILLFSQDSDSYPYKDFLPGYSTTLKQPPLEPFNHVDPGHAALKDANPRSFLDGAKVKNITPKFGSEIFDVDLTKLDTHGRAQLALYVAQRGFAVFRDNQAFIDADPNWQIKFVLLLLLSTSSANYPPSLQRLDYDLRQDPRSPRVWAARQVPRTSPRLPRRLDYDRREGVRRSP